MIIITTMERRAKKMKFDIVIRDSASYEFNTDEISVEEATEKALKWFTERMPEVYIIKDKEEE